MTVNIGLLYLICLKKIKSKSKVKAVLEIPGGDSKLYGINNNSFINIDMIEGN